ncbi:MAG: ANTAR domain-containing response regulator, partial [Clostridium sp.]
MRNNQVVMIALNNLEKAEKIRDMIAMDGYDVAAVCTSGNELIRRALMYDECLIIIGYNLVDMNIN